MPRTIQYTRLASAGAARRGRVETPHGSFETPAFMPVGTQGTVKGLTPDDLQESGAQIVLANTYHLWVRPGHELIRSLGGLHRFMGWSGPILTDSGGYQVFSLAAFAKVKEEGVRFRSPVDGQWRLLTPELAVEIQEALGVDIAMAFDECVEHPASFERVRTSVARTTRWLHRCIAARKRPEQTALFGIVQGGVYPELRAAHAAELTALDLDGYAIGGLSVGESKAELFEMARYTAPLLPEDRPRYLMGVGYPIDIVEAVIAGVDLFDCVIPTRSARFGGLFTSAGRIHIKNARFRDDPRPLDEKCVCYTCARFSRAYLRHLFTSGEVLAPRLLTLHNVTFYQGLVAGIRKAIEAGPDALAALRERAVAWTAPYVEPTANSGAPTDADA